MNALGLMLVGFGVLTAWSGWNRVRVWDLLGAFLGKPAPQPAAFITPDTAAAPPPGQATA